MKKKWIIVGSVIFLGVGALSLYLWISSNKNEDVLVASNKVIDRKVVDKLYQNVKGNECGTNYIEEKTSVDKMSKDSILYLIFSTMKNKGYLSDNISVEQYEKSAKELFQRVEVPLSFDFNYENYTYHLTDGKTITREETKCPEKRYVSKLFGYSNDEDELNIHIHVGYIENNQVYNLLGENIGTYEEKELKNILDKGTSQVYHYKKINGKYYLNDIQ